MLHVITIQTKPLPESPPLNGDGAEPISTEEFEEVVKLPYYRSEKRAQIEARGECGGSARSENNE